MELKLVNIFLVNNTYVIAKDIKEAIDIYKSRYSGDIISRVQLVNKDALAYIKG